MIRQAAVLGAGSHLAVFKNSDTGLYHGALYRNKPTPSGCDRYLLSFSTANGFATPRSAAIAINCQFHYCDPIDLSSVPECTDEEINELFSILPTGAYITKMTQSSFSKGSSKSNETIEVRSTNTINAPLLPITINNDQLKALITRRLVELDCSSGDDPNLSYRYDYYLVSDGSKDD